MVALESSQIDQELVDEVIFGNVIQAGNGQNPAGQCSTHGGIRSEVTKNTVNVVCASGSGWIIVFYGSICLHVLQSNLNLILHQYGPVELFVLGNLLWNEISVSMT